MERLQKAFDALRPTEAQEEKMLREILIARDDAPRRRRRRGNPVRVAALIAAALALCAVTASAAEALGVSQMIRDYFKQKEETSIMDTLNVAASGLSTTAKNGWKITMTDLFGDENRCYVGVTLEAPKGTVLDRSDYILALDAVPAGETIESLQMKEDDAIARRAFDELKLLPQYSFYCEQVADDNPKDNKISFVMRESLDDYKDGMALDFIFEDLFWYDRSKPHENGQQEQTVVKDFGATISNVVTHFASNNGYHIHVNQSVQVFNGTATLEEVYLSPLSVSYVLSGESVEKTFFAYTGNSKDYIERASKTRPTRKERFAAYIEEDTDEYWYGWSSIWELDVPIILHFKDGTSQELVFGAREDAGYEDSGHRNDIPNGRVQAYYVFDGILDLNTLDYITVCDVRVPLTGDK